MQLRTLQRVINARGHKAELVKGDGYFYLSGPDVEFAKSTMIEVYRLNHLSLSQWLDRIEDIIAESKKEQGRLKDAPKLRLVISR